MEGSFSTPMMRQYGKIKAQYTDCLLFYRMGDFYELFQEDALLGSRVLNITLTSKAGGKDGKIPMAGVPYHAVDSYLHKLVKAGYKVAICEQVSLPNKYGLVDREVVRIVTPGTVLDEKSLEKKENNYIVSLLTNKNTIALAIADISTGYFATTEIISNNFDQTISNELSRIGPAECILPESLYNKPEFLRLIKKDRGVNIFPFPFWDQYANDPENVLKKHFAVTSLHSFGIEDKPIALQASAALLGYLQQTQKGPVTHIRNVVAYETVDYLMLDRSTVINLELFTTIRDHESRGTLLSVIDETITAMGGRMLKQWMKKPLIKKEEINKRHDAVEEFLQKQSFRAQLREKLEQVNDVERLVSRLSVGLGNARDLVNLKNSLKIVLQIRDALIACKAEIIDEVIEKIRSDSIVKFSPSPSSSPIKGEEMRQAPSPLVGEGGGEGNKMRAIDNIINLIELNIVPEPPISIREGRMINSGINAELDKLRGIIGNSRDWILEMERKERVRTGINTLKVRFNQVFGFYIEISKANAHLAPKNYFRKQTLVNGERFITEELKKQEEIILTAEEKMNGLEYMLFQETLAKILNEVSVIQNAAEAIAQLDCLLNFSYIAEKNNYTRPVISNSGEIKIIDGRHPVVEKLLQDKQFVPNIVCLDNDEQQLLMITGPNMAGKSVLIRQVALIVLLSQMGSFVPAKQADLSIVDQIFVRSGASDVITSGLSTFMVEMVETAYILHHATEKSLIIMDEIGRGTSTYDGISIAWAVAEHLIKYDKPPKTLFATHYHELQILEHDYPKHIKNFHMSIAQQKDEPIFLYTLLPGGASHSFGVAVAKLAGIPDEVIKRANELLAELEVRGKGEMATVPPLTLHTASLIERLMQKELESLNIHQMTPLDALNKLAELKDKLNFFQNETNLPTS